MNKYGVFLARMQPLHKAHTFLVEQALSECENVVIMLGSSNKKDMIRNPFTLEFRKEMLFDAMVELNSNIDINRITIFELPDWSYENDENDTQRWGHYLYYNIVSRIQYKYFNIYYSDDSSIIKSWFDEEIAKFINLRLYDRTKILEGLSATKIRQSIIDLNIEYLNQFMHKSTINKLDIIRPYYLNVLSNPQSDFSM